MGAVDSSQLLDKGQKTLPLPRVQPRENPGLCMLRPMPLRPISRALEKKVGKQVERAGGDEDLPDYEVTEAAVQEPAERMERKGASSTGLNVVTGPPTTGLSYTDRVNWRPRTPILTRRKSRTPVLRPVKGAAIP